ncbi:hypothetical protein BDR04DRAFT_1101647 [Suillus decipiens]|nr:hypothetical protein BDR04DRAFT_1101647 [Suillus decipiens]
MEEGPDLQSACAARVQTQWIRFGGLQELLRSPRKFSSSLQNSQRNIQDTDLKLLWIFDILMGKISDAMNPSSRLGLN